MLQKLEVVLKFIVVGGGASGLAAAYALRKAGHDVLVLEKRGKDDKQPDVATGFPPNATAIVKEWEIGDEFLSSASRLYRSFLVDGGDGNLLGALPSDLFEVLETDFMAGFFIVQYSTWYNTLYEALLREGVEVRFDSPVENLEPNDGFTRVHLQSGEVFEADVVVAADGIGSAIRGEVNDSSTDLGETEKLLILNASVSRDDMDAYGLWPAPRTKELNTFDLYSGEEFFCLGGAPEDKYMLSAVLPYTGPAAVSESCEWTNINELPAYAQTYVSNNLSKQLQHLIQKANSLSMRVINDHAELPETLSSTDLRTILVGKAAHTATCFSFHAVALGIEDAQTLGYLFSRIQKKNQISFFLEAYNEIRHARVAYAHGNDERRGVIFRAPKGPMKTARDARIKQLYEATERGEITEEMVMENWADIVNMATYNSADRAEDWWLQYGSTVVRSPLRSSMQISISLHTQEDSRRLKKKAAMQAVH